MSVETIERDFKAKVSDRIHLMAEGYGSLPSVYPICF